MKNKLLINLLRIIVLGIIILGVLYLGNKSIEKAEKQVKIKNFIQQDTTMKPNFKQELDSNNMNLHKADSLRLINS